MQSFMFPSLGLARQGDTRGTCYGGSSRGIYIDMNEQRQVCVKPSPPFTPLFRVDGMEEKEDGCFYYEEDEEARHES